MINPDKRKAIYLLHNEGMASRDIARRLNVNKNTVGTIIAQKGVLPESNRKDKIEVEAELLRRLHGECNGWGQRIHEKLTEEYDIQIGYSTITRQIRMLGLGSKKKSRCEKVPDTPGAEMQHDTSPYTFQIGDKRVAVVAFVIYLRYSKIRYLKFYRCFNRFNMKCFFHEALRFWKYFTVETNFFSGRSFASMEDLKQQAFEWATVRMPNRPVAKTGLLPAKAFDYEQPLLVKAPPFVSPPYIALQRRTDQYGYAACDGYFYWVPGTSREEVTVLQYSDSLKIYLRRALLAEYELPAVDVKNKRIWPVGKPRPTYQRAHRKKPTVAEEKRLRDLDPQINT